MEAPPYKICFDNILGRHLVATHSIDCGTVILEEPPLIRGPFFHTYAVCLACGKILTEASSRPCSKCGWPLCDENCEKSPNHQPECILTVARGNKISIKNFGVSNPNYQFVTILRALYLKQAAPEMWEKLMQLQPHPIDVNIAPPSFIRKLFKLDDWSEDKIKKVAEILTINGHELPIARSPQLAVYDKTSLLEHCCQANCTKTFTNEGHVLVIAARQIEENEHLSICYTDPLWGVENRRLHLHQTKHFWCSCSRCEDPSEMGTNINSIRCPNESCSGFVLPKTFLQEIKIWNCDSCDAVFSNDNISLLLGKIGAEVSEMPKEDAAACKQFIKKYDKVLAATHFYMIDVKMALSHMLSSENYEELSYNDLKLLFKTTEELKMVAETIAPAERRLLGLILYRLAKTKIEMARRDDDEGKFRSVLAESRNDFCEARLFLANEPTVLPEGRVCLKIGLELKLIDDLLTKK
ncbi:SET domain-containing protein SmydA-8-like [Zophobas morio]|uniref:SET domain-containing protein SmydA-8-like n=1 Tax=Zophobas morio TaxID=2755281 RepID=UPI0030827200